MISWGFYNDIYGLLNFSYKLCTYKDSLYINLSYSFEKFQSSLHIRLEIWKCTTEIYMVYTFHWPYFLGIVIVWMYILATDIAIFGRNHKNGLYIFYLVCFNKQKIYFGLTVVLSRLFSSDVYKKFFFYYFGCNILKTQRKFVSKRKLL